MTGGIAELLVAAVTDGDDPDRAELVGHLTDMWLSAASIDSTIPP